MMVDLTYVVDSDVFVPVDIDGVVRVYTDIMMWVQRHPKYLDLAKAKFARPVRTAGSSPTRGFTAPPS